VLALCGLLEPVSALVAVGRTPQARRPVLGGPLAPGVTKRFVLRLKDLPFPYRFCDRGLNR